MVEKKFDDIKELTDKINHDDLICFFAGNAARERNYNFNNGIEILRKIQSGKKKLQLAKKLGNVFKSNLNKISKERQQVNEQKSTLKILNCFTNQKKLLSNYLVIIFQSYLRLNTKKFMEKNFNFVSTSISR